MHKKATDKTKQSCTTCPVQPIADTNDKTKQSKAKSNQIKQNQIKSN